MTADIENKNENNNLDPVIQKKINMKKSYTQEMAPRPEHPADPRYYEALNWIKERVSSKPKVGVVCGSGLGKFADTLQDVTSFNYKDIPHFPVSTVEGHKGCLVFGKLNGKEIVCMQGRFHLYEGYEASACAFPIRLFKLLGVEKLALTNAAGGLNQNFKLGDFMLVKDHLNLPALLGLSPTLGVNDLYWGPRFINMHNCYDSELLDLAKKVAAEIGEKQIQEGVYQCQVGPCYETVAEQKLAQAAGVDALGMSTVYEVVAARHCEIKCFAISMITNICNPTYDVKTEVNHEEVIECATTRGDAMVKLITAIISKW